MKEWFKARNLWGAAILALPDEKAGQIAKAIWSYTMNGESVHLDDSLAGMFAMILMTLQQDEIKDAEISEKRSKATDSIRNQKASSDIKTNQMISNDIKYDQMISNDDNKNKNKNKNKSIEQEQDKEKENKRFSPPSVEEVADYCKKRNNSVDPQRFVDFYASKGWKVGNQPMKDWQACVRTWEQRDKTPKKVIAQAFPQRDYSDVQDEMMTDLAEEMETFKKREGCG